MDIQHIVKVPDNKQNTIYTRLDVAKHNKMNDCWVIVDNDIYDVTKFMDFHPGGFQSIFYCAGDDATEEFKNVGHSKEAYIIIKKYHIGTLIKPC